MGEKVKAVLYLGIDPKHFKTDKPLIHCPLLEIVARPIDSMEIKQVFGSILDYTHIIFTSKSAVKIFFKYFRDFGYQLDQLNNKYLIAMGQVTAYFMKEEGAVPTYIAAEESLEGVMRVLSTLDLNQANVLFPKSSSAMPSLAHFLVEHEIHHQICTLYDVYNRKQFSLPDLNDIDEIIFPNSKTIDIFFSLFDTLPEGIKLQALGAATRETLKDKLSEKKNLVISC